MTPLTVTYCKQIGRQGCRFITIMKNHFAIKKDLPGKAGVRKTVNSHRSFELRWLFLRLILLCDNMEQSNKSDYISARLPVKNRLSFLLRKLDKSIDKNTWHYYNNTNKTWQGGFTMNKDDILEKSRRENKGPDEMEQYVMAAAGKIAAKVGMLVCCIVAILQVIFTDAISFESWMIYFSILATTFLVKYIKLHSKHELWVAVLYTVLFIMFAVLFILRLVG